MKRTTALVLSALTLFAGVIIGWRVQVHRYVLHRDRQDLAWNRSLQDFKERAGVGLGVAEEAQGKLKIFILAGQSNMSGRGVLPDSIETDPRIFMLGNDFRWRVGSEPTDNPHGQVDFVSYDRSAGVSPGMSFARTLLEHEPNLYIGLVPVAMGGTSLHQWRRSLSDTTLYGAMLKRVRAASVMGEVAGFLWFQGEADARSESDTYRRPLGAKWNEGFEELVANVRSDLGLPGLPVIYAQLGTHTSPVYEQWEEVKASQINVSLPAMAMIISEDLPLMDNVHFTSSAYKEIGRRFAREYLNLTGSQFSQTELASKP